MSNWIALSALLVGVVAGGFAGAQQGQVVQAVPQAEPKIFIGQPLRDALAVLAARKIEVHEGGFAVAYQPDQSHLSFKLDDDHTWVCAGFSRSRQTITDISMVFFPSRTLGAKLYESWLPAVALTLHPDTSYTVQFAKPRTLEQNPEAERNRPPPVYPSSTLK